MINETDLWSVPEFVLVAGGAECPAALVRRDPSGRLLFQTPCSCDAWTKDIPFEGAVCFRREGGAYYFCGAFSYDGNRGVSVDRKSDILQDRRRKGRIAVPEIVGRMREKGLYYPETTVSIYDLSEHGAKVEGGSPLRVGTHYTIEFGIDNRYVPFAVTPNDTVTFSAVCEVMYACRRGEALRYGIRFEKLSPDNERLLRACVERGSRRVSGTEPPAHRSEQNSVGDYALQKMILVDSWGSVHLGTHRYSRQTYAVRVFPDSFASQPRLVKRFHEIVPSLLRVRHANLANVVHAGEEKSRFYLVCEHTEDETLEAVLQKRGCFPTEEAADLLLQACSGLEAAHDVGLLHGSLCPAVITVGPEGSLKIHDLGLAAIAGDIAILAGDLTTAIERGWVSKEPGRWQRDIPRLKGSRVLFLSPEQIAGEPAGPASDLYSLGAVFLHVLTGKFWEDPEALLAGASLSVDVSDLLRRLLRPNFLERPSTTASLRGELERLLSGNVAPSRADEVVQTREPEPPAREEPPPSSPVERIPAPVSGAGRADWPGILRRCFACLLIAVTAGCLILAGRALARKRGLSSVPRVSNTTPAVPWGDELEGTVPTPLTEEAQKKEAGKQTDKAAAGETSPKDKPPAAASPKPGPVRAQSLREMAESSRLTVYKMEQQDYVSLRSVLRVLGEEDSLVVDEGRVAFSHGGHTVNLRLNRPEMVLDGVRRRADAPIREVAGDVLVPFVTMEGLMKETGREGMSPGRPKE